MLNDRPKKMNTAWMSKSPCEIIPGVAQCVPHPTPPPSFPPLKILATPLRKVLITLCSGNKTKEKDWHVLER